MACFAGIEEPFQWRRGIVAATVEPGGSAAMDFELGRQCAGGGAGGIAEGGPECGREDCGNDMRIADFRLRVGNWMGVSKAWVFRRGGLRSGPRGATGRTFAIALSTLLG